MTTEAPWSEALRSAYGENYPSAGKKLQAGPTISLPIVSSVSGGPQVKRVDFAKFCSSDERVLVFSAKANNGQLVANLRASSDNCVIWEMPKTGHVFTLTGKAYIVAAPSLSHRFGTPPKRISLPENVYPEEYWEASREAVWASLNPRARATFTWPSGSSPRTPIEGSVESIYNGPDGRPSSSKVGLHVLLDEMVVGFKYMRLDALSGDAVVPASPGAPPTREQELLCIHNAAKDNLCLVVLKVLQCEVLEPASAISPPQRCIYQFAAKDGSWSCVEMNP